MRGSSPQNICTSGVILKPINGILCTMTFYKSDMLDELVRLTNALKKHPALVGIDGRGGSGKSTLARELAAQFDDSVAVVEGDDFYRDMSDTERIKLTPEEGYELYFDWQRLKSEVLEPIHGGQDSLR